MSEITIIHRIEAPELSAALNNLADALRGGVKAVLDVQPVVTIPGQEKPVEAPANPTNAPVTDTVSGATSVTTSAPTVAAPTLAPTGDTAPATTATSKPVTFDDITAAGSQLLDQGKMNQLMDLLKSFGVQAITQLKPEQYPAVAAGLKELGAKI